MTDLSAISGFRRDVDEIWALLWYHAAFSGISVPTFRDTLSVSHSWTSWPLKMGPIGCPETLVHNYHSKLRNIPEERRSQIFPPLHVFWSLPFLRLSPPFQRPCSFTLQQHDWLVYFPWEPITTHIIPYISWQPPLPCTLQTAWPLKMGPIDRPETSITNYQQMLPNISEERRPLQCPMSSHLS